MIGRRKDIPESGEYDRPCKVYLRVDKPAVNYAAKQIDTEIWTGFCAVQPISTMVYYSQTQVSNKATHYIYFEYIPSKTDPKTLGHGAVVKVQDEDIVYRLLRPMVLRHNFAIRYEAVELGADAPEGTNTSLADEVIS